MKLLKTQKCMDILTSRHQGHNADRKHFDPDMDDAMERYRCPSQSAQKGSLAANIDFPDAITTAAPITSADAFAFDFRSFLNSQIAASKTRPQSRSWPMSIGVQTQLNSIKWHEAIERLLEVRCDNDRMTIVLHYEKTYSRLPSAVIDILQKGRLYTEATGPNPPGCSSSTGIVPDEAGVLVLTFDYDDCGVELGPGPNDTIVYSSSVVVEATTKVRSADHFDSGQQDDGQQASDIREIKEHYRFRCVHPSKKQALQESLTFSLLLSDEKYPKSYWTCPRKTDLGSLVYIYSDVALSWYQGSGLYSFPINCWTSPHHISSNSSVKSRRKMFLKDGCPVNDSRGRGLAYVHHFTAGPTKVSVHLGQYLLFGDAYDGSTGDREQKNMVMLNCDVAPCVQSFTFGLLDVPKCPISYYCAGIPQLSHALPAQLRRIRPTAISAGPVILRDKNEQMAAKAAAANSSANCQMMCKQQRMARVKLGNQQQHEHQSGYVIRTRVVIVVALISFIFGLLAMGALWWIHNRTDPTISKSEDPSDNNDSSPAEATATTRFGSTPTDQPRRSWHLSRFKLRDTANDSSSGKFPFSSPGTTLALASTPAATSGINMVRIRTPCGNDQPKLVAASSSMSPTSALLTSAHVETDTGPVPNVDAQTARRLLNALR